MSKIKKAFENKKAFIPFITCGDPDLDTTEKIVYAMEEAGADLIELGIPFSDPTAEGPVIQEANIRALKNRITTDDVFAMVGHLRQTVKVPLVFMTYANVVFSYGAERFLSCCQQVGIDGIILPDIPFEEKDEFSKICEDYQVEWISMIAPTSKDRIQMIAREAQGFLYCVSSLGVTGIRENITTDIDQMVKFAKRDKEIPCAVGFGVSTPQQAKEMAQYADGIIVGSAIVKICARYGRDCVPYISQYVKEMKEVLQ